MGSRNRRPESASILREEIRARRRRAGRPRWRTREGRSPLALSLRCEGVRVPTWHMNEGPQC